LGFGPAIENGFYYDFQFSKPLEEKDLERIEGKMKEIILANQKFVGKKLTKLVAKKLFKDQPYKLELIKELPGKTVSIYTNGNFTDLCKGPHAKNTKEIERIPMLRYYNVFNIAQCEGIPKEKLPPAIERNNNPIETCEKIINEMPKKPQIIHKEQNAYYHKLNDYINVPKMETFNSSENYYGTLFHELVHSTGHNERLNRKELIQNKSFRTDEYAIEELTAEMGASYLKSYSGIPIEQLENNASYIQGWLEKLKNDKKFIIYASSQAQKATDYILNVQSKELEIGEDREKGRVKELETMRGQREKSGIEITR
jgi:antirestriction protein ArdC